MVQKIKKYVSDVTKEMKKVTWPTKEQLKESTTVVFVATFFFTVLVYVMDWIFGEVINFIFS
jgi:preprotein translocase subunit SecE